MQYRVMILCLALLATDVAPASAQSFAIVDADKLGRHWRLEPDILLMEVGKNSEQGYGCIAVGFIIDRGGRVTAARAMRRAFAKEVAPRTARDLSMGVVIGSQMLGPYTPAPENPSRAEVFTALAIPVIGRKRAKGLSFAQRQAIAAQLRPSCEIADLAAWVDSRDMRKEPAIETAPEIDFSANAAAQPHSAD